MGFSCPSVSDKEAQRGHKAAEVIEPTGDSLILWNEPFFLIKKKFLLEYSCFTMLNVVYVSPVQKSESAIHIHISPLFWDFLPI